jgi:hypothetical protein
MVDFILPTSSKFVSLQAFQKEEISIVSSG